jgi:hypothetical protein
MKNIHILPTDKPSRLILDKDDNILHLQIVNVFMEHQYLVENQHIYITSDEEIKEGDWFYDTDSNKIGINYNPNDCKKIILTTDQDLIKDGVQPIDDKFLEWFVNNPSCESVDLDTFSMRDKVLYNVVFPKEVPKQETFEKELITDDSEITPDYFQPKSHIESIFEILDKKQETLEAAAEEYSEKFHYAYGQQSIFYQIGFKEGANWQAERMYSVEEMKEAFYEGQKELSNNNDFSKLLEQFKKK